MLQEYLKINNPRQQRKYLDKKYQDFKKKEMSLEDAKKVVELNDYLERIHFWQKYNSIFEQTVNRAKAMVMNESIEQGIQKLNEQDRVKYESFCETIFSYEQDVVVDIYSATKQEIASILVYAIPESKRAYSKSQVQSKVLEMFEQKGYLEIHYFNKRRALKKLKV